MPPESKDNKRNGFKCCLQITRADGIEAINAKNVAAYLKCSTQPVMYNFATIEELKLAVFDQAFEYMKRKVGFSKRKKERISNERSGTGLHCLCKKRTEHIPITF